MALVGVGFTVTSPVTTPASQGGTELLRILKEIVRVPGVAQLNVKGPCVAFGGVMHPSQPQVKFAPVAAEPVKFKAAVLLLVELLVQITGEMVKVGLGAG